MTLSTLTINDLVETIPQLQHDCAALAARNATLEKALAVIVAKIDAYEERCGLHQGEQLIEVWLPVTRGEAAVWRRLACPSSVGAGGE